MFRQVDLLVVCPVSRYRFFNGIWIRWLLRLAASLRRFSTATCVFFRNNCWLRGLSFCLIHGSVLILYPSFVLCIFELCLWSSVEVQLVFGCIDVCSHQFEGEEVDNFYFSGRLCPPRFVTCRSPVGFVLCRYRLQQNSSGCWDWPPFWDIPTAICAFLWNDRRFQRVATPAKFRSWVYLNCIALPCSPCVSCVWDARLWVKWVSDAWTIACEMVGIVNSCGRSCFLKEIVIVVPRWFCRASRYRFQQYFGCDWPFLGQQFYRISLLCFLPWCVRVRTLMHFRSIKLVEFKKKLFFVKRFL